MIAINDKNLAPDLRTVITRLVKKLRKKSSTGEKLSLTERSTLALLDQHKQLLPNELANMEKITTQSMSQILAHLLQLGYITRTASQTDRRKVIIALSDSGRAILNKVRNEREQWINQALAETCSADDLAVLRQAIILLTRLVDYE